MKGGIVILQRTKGPLYTDIQCDNSSATYSYRATADKNNSALSASHDPNIELHKKNGILLGFLLETLVKRATDAVIEQKGQTGLFPKTMKMCFSRPLHADSVLDLCLSMKYSDDDEHVEIIPSLREQGSQNGNALDKSVLEYALLTNLPTEGVNGNPGLTYVLSEEDAYQFYRSVDDFDPFQFTPIMFPLALTSKAIADAILTGIVSLEIPGDQFIIYRKHVFDFYQGSAHSRLGKPVTFYFKEPKTRGPIIILPIEAADSEKEIMFKGELTLAKVPKSALMPLQ